MQRRASLFILLGLIAACLAGCQHTEESAPVSPPSGAAMQPAPGNPNGKAGAAPSAAPTVGVNPDYNAPAMGSKGK
jgi:hypothetical protein